MLLPPDPRNTAINSKLPQKSKPNRPKPIGVGYAVFAGVSFALVRFLIGAAYILTALEPTRNKAGEHGLADAAWIVSATASVFAGLVGGLLWWLNRTRASRKATGSWIGLLTGVSSYLGIAIGVGVVFSVQTIGGFGDAAENIGMILIMGLLCGFGSASVTGVVVLPALIVVGVALSAMQRASEKPIGEAN